MIEKKLIITDHKKKIHLIFLCLIIIVNILMAYYWFFILKVQLKKEAIASAKALNDSYSTLIADALNEKNADEQNTKLKKAFDRITVFKNPETDLNYVMGIKLELDDESTQIEDNSILKRGEIDCVDCIKTKIPIFSIINHELLGIAYFYNNPKYFFIRLNSMRKKYMALIGAVSTLLIFIWLILGFMVARLIKAEEDIQRKQAQLTHTDRLTSMGRMSTGIAHEINQPLQIIRTNAELLNRIINNSSNMENKAIERIVFQVKRASTIINNMCSFVRLKSDSLEYVNLYDPVNSVLSFFKEQFRMHQIQLNLDCPEDLNKVKTNPFKLQQIIINLITNARDAVEKKAESTAKDYNNKIIDIRLFIKEKILILEVEDNGIGMNAETKNRCMEPFYTTKDVGEGMGLGLSIVYGIIKELNMEIKIESSENKGSKFQIIFPTSLMEVKK